MIHRHQWTVTASGTTGTATSDRPLNGRLLAVHLNFSAGMAATCDTTITRTSDGAMPVETLLTISNSATDAWYRPRVAVQSTAGANIVGATDTFEIDGYLTVSLAQATTTETVTVTVLLER